MQRQFAQLTIACKEGVLLLSEDVEVAHEQQRRQELLDELQKRTRELRQLEARLADLQRRWEQADEFPHRWLLRRAASQLQTDIRMVQKQVELLRAAWNDLSCRVEEAEQNVAFVRKRYNTRVADILCNPANARELFGASGAPAADDDKTQARVGLLAAGAQDDRQQ